MPGSEATTPWEVARRGVLPARNEWGKGETWVCTDRTVLHTESVVPPGGTRQGRAEHGVTGHRLGDRTLGKPGRSQPL